MNPNVGNYLGVVHHAHDGCQYEPREHRGALITDRHFRTTQATVIVGPKNARTGIQYRLCAECATLPHWNSKGQRHVPIREVKH